MMKTLLSLVFLATPLFASAAAVPHFTAKIYDTKDHSKQLLDYKSEYETNGAMKTYTNTTTDLKGEVLVIEKTVMMLNEDSETLVSFEQDQKQLGTYGKLDVHDGKVFFSFKNKDGKIKTDDEKAGADFIVPATLVTYMQTNWEKIAKGEAVKARLGVLDRQETVGFQFKKETDKEIAGAPGIVVKMKPSSVIISAIVNPLMFGFSADGKTLRELEGRVSAKQNVDGKFKDLDGFTVYTFAPPVAAAHAETPAPEPAKTSVKSKAKKKK